MVIIQTHIFLSGSVTLPPVARLAVTDKAFTGRGLPGATSGRNQRTLYWNNGNSLVTNLDYTNGFFNNMGKENI